MRTYLPEFDVVSPRTLDEALRVLSQNPPPTPLAGGTDLMVLMNAGQLKPGAYLNLHSISDLHRPIEEAGKEIVFSALTTYSEARRHPLVRRCLPMLGIAAREIGALQIQSRGTWAGNIVNASPAADGVPALMAYDTRVELASHSGTRTVNLCDFYLGYKKTVRRPDELITAIRISIPADRRIEYYRKVGTRKFQAISKVLLAGVIVLEGRRVEKIRLVFASVMPFTYRARQTESILQGRDIDSGLIAEALDVLKQELNPIDDIRSTARYRLGVAARLFEEFLQKARMK